MSVIVKLRYHDEIRRLSLPRSTLSFQHLINEIKNTLLISKFSVKYLDEENDQISLSSDIELREAVRQVDERKEQVIKLVVNEESPIVEPPPTPKLPVPVESSIPVSLTEPVDSPPERHQSHKIICSSCNIEIIGTRWKCSVCPNLNLCELCEPWDKHNVNHPFLRMKLPISPGLETAYSTFANVHTFGQQINHFLVSPHFMEVSNTLKQISDETFETVKIVTDQLISQTKEFNKEFRTVIKNEADNVYALCSNLNNEISKTLSPIKSNDPRTENSQPVFEYAQQLKSITDMGFTNEARIRSLLLQFKGDVNQCIHSLI